MSRLVELKNELMTLEAHYAKQKKLLSDEIKDIESGMIDSVFPCDYCSVRVAHNCNICSEYSRFVGKKVKQL